MKIHSLIFLLLTSLLILTGCSHDFFYQTTVNKNLVREDWMSKINLSSDNWTRNADSWFLTGEPNQIEQYSRMAPSFAAITTSSVNVGNFTNIIVDGDFQVQIVGSQLTNSVYVVGPNNLARQVSVQNFNNALRIMQAKDCKGNMKNVIVRIGVRELRGITNLGKGNIYGRNITSGCLIVKACDCGCIFLSGEMNLNKVIQLGKGTITIIGAFTPSLDITVKGNGNVNVCGRVGVQNIVHIGDGCINIIGADTNCLSIFAAGCGTTSIAGYVNLRKLTACDNSRVYVYWVNSSSLYITQSGNSHVGLAGAATNMNLDMKDGSRFGGQYLHGGSVYVRTRDWAHANVTADKKVFAAATDKSSIYLFGSSNIVSRYSTGSAVILPVWNDSCMVPPMPMARPMYKN